MNEMVLPGSFVGSTIRRPTSGVVPSPQRAIVTSFLPPTLPTQVRDLLRGLSSLDHPVLGGSLISRGLADPRWELTTTVSLSELEGEILLSSLLCDRAEELGDLD